ncbi:MAG: hypothetical protein ACRDSZ_04560 [Pseudonocardiaceae bacterium]
MTSVESVLTSRNASLSDLVALLRRQHDAKLDVVVPARDMRMSGGELHIGGIGQPTITLDGVTPARGMFRPTPICDGGIADKLGIPSQYLRRMRETQVALLDCNVNTWLADEPTKRYLIRTLRGEGEQPGIARAMLSEKYKITDNLDVLMAVLDGIRRTGVHTEISRCDLTEKRMYVKVRSPEVAAYAPQLLADYRSPFSGLRGADNPVVFAGFVISNSETGHGSFSIIPQVTIQVCDNGMTFTKNVLFAPEALTTDSSIASAAIVQAVGVATWLSWVINLLVAERWLDQTRSGLWSR